MDEEFNDLRAVDEEFNENLREVSYERFRAMSKGSEEIHVDNDALVAAALKIEDLLIDMRDSRMFTLGANGFVVNERDNTPSSVLRLRTIEGLRIGIKAYLKALENNKDTEDGNKS